MWRLAASSNQYGKDSLFSKKCWFFLKLAFIKPSAFPYNIKAKTFSSISVVQDEAAGGILRNEGDAVFVHREDFHLDGKDFADAERLVERDVGKLGYFLVRSRVNLFLWGEGNVEKTWSGINF